MGWRFAASSSTNRCTAMMRFAVGLLLLPCSSVIISSIVAQTQVCAAYYGCGFSVRQLHLFKTKKKSNSLLQSYVGFYIVSLGGPTRICCASCSLFWASPRVHYRKEKARLGRLSRPKKQNKKNLLRLGSWSPSRSTKLSYVTLKKKKIILRVCSSHVAALIQKRKLKAAAAC